jgi:plasmid maintenance system killer protein
MIASFRDKETERLWQSGRSRRLPVPLQLRAFKKLAILNAAVALHNLRVPPFNWKRFAETAPGSTAFGSTINIAYVSCGKTEMLLM